MIKTFLGAASAAILSLTLLAPAAYAAPPAAAFGELPVAKDGAISPDGTRVAAIVNNGGNYYVVSKSLANPAEKPWTLPVGEKVYPGSIVWANDDMFLLSISRDGKYAGTPYTQTFLFAANVKTQEADVLVKPKGYFRQFNDRIVSLLDDDPEHILMAYANETFDSFPDVKKVNLKILQKKSV